MISEKFILLGALLNIIGSSTYAYHTIKGKTRPDRVSWLLWVLAPLIAFAAELDEHVGLQSLMTFMVGFGPLLVFVASFLNQKSYWNIKKLDVVCGVLSILALIFWMVSGVGNIAILLSITTDLLAGIPTLVKAYQNPETEHHSVFRNATLSAGIVLLTIKHWTFASYGYPLYIFIFCGLLYLLIRFKLGKDMPGHWRAVSAIIEE